VARARGTRGHGPHDGGRHPGGPAHLPAVQRVQTFGEGVTRTARDTARRSSDLVIDAGPGDSREVERALRVADIATVPVQPAGLDFRTLGLIDDRVGEAQEGERRGCMPAAA
jgi:hypothetical protein